MDRRASRETDTVTVSEVRREFSHFIISNHQSKIRDIASERTRCTRVWKPSSVSRHHVCVAAVLSR